MTAFALQASRRNNKNKEHFAPQEQRDNYFSNYPLKTEISKTIHLIKQFYDLRTFSNNENKYDIFKLNA